MGVNRVITMSGSILVVLLALTISTFGLEVESAQAHCVSQDTNNRMYIREDAFWNFDYQDRDNDRCNVDWPANLLFWNDAAVDKVKNRFEAIGWDRTGSDQAARLDNGHGMKWNNDIGVKTFSPSDCAFGDMEHMRLYAANGDRMYNLSWGFWVLGTSHIDHRECSPSAWFGLSEEAENRIADDARRVTGVTDVAEDWDGWGNRLPFRIAHNDHFLDNDGRATAIRFR